MADSQLTPSQSAPPLFSPFGLSLFLVFLVVILALKLFTITVGTLQWGRNPGFKDFLFLISPDALLALAVFSLWGIHGIVKRSLRFFLLRWIPFLFFLLALLPLLSILLLYLTCFYVVAEWGAFLEPRLIQAAVKAQVDSSIWHYVLSFKTILILGGILFLFWASWKTRGLLTCPQKQRKLTSVLIPFLGMAALGTPISLADPYQLDPADSSPLFLLLKEEDLHSDGIGPSIPSPSLEGFSLPPRKKVQARYQNLFGKAKGKDLIYIVLESCRLQNLDLYGYKRETMPTYTKMGKQGIVFTNAYVNQPRSCKTMVSMILGVYPDPRLRSMSWLPRRFRGKDNILKRFLEKGYQLYFGTTVSKTFDNFDGFIMNTAGKVNRSVGRKEFHQSGANKGLAFNDDKILFRDFAQWYAKQKGKVIALLWPDCGHHPYNPVRKTFSGDRLIDRYDNCLKSCDDALAELLQKIEAIGKKDQAVIISFGDHGEAFEEHVGDTLHGNFLYDTSVRIPCVLYHPTLFQGLGKIANRFQVKDIPGTLLWLWGDKKPLNQSHNIFSKGLEDKIYMTIIYKDFKMGMVEGNKKFVYHPRRSEDHFFDFVKDPEEQEDLIHTLPQEEIRKKRRELLQYFFYQIQYLNTTFPELRANNR
jgi:hypothetical protein